MTIRSPVKITKRAVDALCVENKDAIVWDRELLGFGVRVYPSGRKMYVVQCRGPLGSKRVALGLHGEIAADQARKRAAMVISRIKAGEDPSDDERAKTECRSTVADLATRFLAEHAEVHCKPRTVENYRWALEKLVIPELGNLGFEAVQRRHAQALHYKMRDKPSAANRAVVVAHTMFAWAKRWGLHRGGSNPFEDVPKYKSLPRQRYLSREEFERLGRVLDACEADGSIWPYAIAAIRLLALTGCRHREITSLRWKDVDFKAGEIRLRDSKTGARLVPLTPTVAQLLRRVPRVCGNPWVIVGRAPGTHLSCVTEQWLRLRGRAGLEDVRIHDLRHSWASRALALGESLTMIGNMLGHRSVETTARYAHLMREEIKASASHVGDSLGADIMAEERRRARIGRGAQDDKSVRGERELEA